MAIEEMGFEEKARIRATDLYKATILALSDNGKTITSRESIYESNLSPFIFYSPLNSSSPAEPIVTIPANSFATLLEKTMPQNAEGRVHFVGVHFVTAAETYVTFNFMVNGQILPEMDKKFLFESFPNMMPLKIPLTVESTLKIVGFNADPVAPHQVKMIVTGYYQYLGASHG